MQFSCNYLSPVVRRCIVGAALWMSGSFLFVVPSSAQWVQTDGLYGGIVMSLCVNGSNVFAGTSNGVFLSSDYGSSWKASGLIGPTIRSFALMNSKIFAGTSIGVFVSADNGRSWTSVNTGLGSTNIQNIAACGTNLFAVSAGGAVYLSGDNGASWNSVTSEIANIGAGVLVTYGSYILAGGSGGNVCLSANSGTTWTTLNIGVAAYTIQAIAYSGTNIFVGTNAGVYVSTNLGLAWNAVNTGLTNTNVRALLLKGSTLYAGTDDGVFVTSDNGAAWAAANSGLSVLGGGTYSNYHAGVYALALSGTSLIAGTYGYGIYTSSDNGASWNRMNHGLNENNIFALASSGSMSFAGASNGVFASWDDGTTWETTSITDAYVRSIAASGWNFAAASPFNGVFVSSNGGASWTISNSGMTSDTVYAVAYYGSRIIAGVYGAGIFISDDNGLTWAASNSGFTNKYVFTLLKSGDYVYAGTYGGGVFMSEDGGIHWSEMNVGLGSLIVRTLTTGGLRVLAGTEDAGVFVSTNSGANWFPSNSGLGTDTVFALTSYGSNVFAGTNRGPYVSTNGGADWRSVNEGLDWNVHSLSISGAMLNAGTFGAGIWHRPLSEMIETSIDLEFSVNVGVIKAAGGFDPARNIVVVRGDFEHYVNSSYKDWFGNQFNMTRSSLNDSVYAVIVHMNNFTLGSTIRYKFVIVDTSGGQTSVASLTDSTGPWVNWENTSWNLGPDGNRAYVLTGDANQSIPTAYFNNVFGPLETHNITFQADLSRLIELGFNPSTDAIDVRGGWPPLTWGKPTPMSRDVSNPNLYKLTVKMPMPAGSELGYKFHASPESRFKDSGWENLYYNRSTYFYYSDIVLPPVTPAIHLLNENPTLVRDTIWVPDDHVQGTLNRVIDSVQSIIGANGLPDNADAVFMLHRGGYYVTNGMLYIFPGTHYTILGEPAPASGTDQGPAIIIIDCYNPSNSDLLTCFGDLSAKNVRFVYGYPDRPLGWVTIRFDQGDQQVAHGSFEDCIFDNVRGVAVTSIRSGFVGTFKNCIFRNCIDPTQFWAGRMFSTNTDGQYFTDTVVDSIIVTNCTFENMGFVFQEDYIPAKHAWFNHNTFINIAKYPFKVYYMTDFVCTNNIFVNCHFAGERFIDRYQGALQDPDTLQFGAVIDIDTMDIRNGQPGELYNGVEENERIVTFFNNSNYTDPMFQTFYDRYNDTVGTQSGMLLPEPIMNKRTLSMFSYHPHMNMASIYDSTDPGFTTPGTNKDSILAYLSRRYEPASYGVDAGVFWGYYGDSASIRSWPLHENLAYANPKLLSAGMGGFPLGDLYHWFPAKYAAWEVQQNQENDAINAIGENESAKKFTRVLSTGWNLVSWNLGPGNDSTKAVLSDISSNVTVALGFDKEGLTYDPSVPPNINTLGRMDNRHGYWLKMKSSDTLSMAGAWTDPQTIIKLDKGWNLISYLPTLADSTRHALACILDSTIVVQGFDGGALTYDPALAPEFNSLKVMSPGFGYWIKSKSLDTLIYPGTVLLNPAVRKLLASSSGILKKAESAVAPTSQWISVWAQSVALDGQPVPAGTVVRAVDKDGTTCGQFIVTYAGKVGLMPIYADDPDTKADEGARTGEDVSVFIGECKTPVRVKWTVFGDVIDLSDALTAIGGELSNIPAEFALHQNYPNPFNPSTTIKYDLPKEANVSMKIYNVLGQEVATLVNENKKAGYHSLVWNGRGKYGAVSSGVYFCRITAGSFNRTIKMLLVK